MQRLLISWIGQHDIDSIEEPSLGPIRAALNAAKGVNKPYDHIHLLYSYHGEQVSPFLDLLNDELQTHLGHGFSNLTTAPVTLSSPNSYSEIYPAVEQHLEQLYKQFSDYKWTVHLSPGTPAMSSVWILLVKTQYPAECIESWLDKATHQNHVKTVNLPFNIDAEYTQQALTKADEKLTKQSIAKPTAEDVGLKRSAFDWIIGSSGSIRLAKQRAAKMAKRHVPVLLLGESGTGKELFARAIHSESNRKTQAFIPVNCAALPEDLAESLLFGHRKGAFTGAVKDHAGYFEQADGGSLFLDEIGELPLTLQAKLLRALQEQEFTPVGAVETVSVDVRIISATHRDLAEMMNEESFREDLFYRLAIGVIKIPALSERTEDVPELVEHLLKRLDDEFADQPDYVRKATQTLNAETQKGKNNYLEIIKFISDRHWRGNIRELQATLQRAMIWSDEPELTSVDIEQATLELPTRSNGSLLKELTQPVDIKEKQDEIARHYIQQAIKKTGGNKTKAAKLVGFNSQQTLTSWMDKLGINQIMD